MEVEVARVSSKGQIVIPHSVRKMLGIKTNDRFLVFGSDDTIVFKKISIPAIKKSFEEITAPLAKRVKELGITEEKVEEEIFTGKDTLMSHNERFKTDKNKHE